MEPVKEKQFVMVRAWWKVEGDADCTVNNISDNLSSTEFGFEVRKLHVLYCVHHVNFFTKVKLMEISGKEIKRHILVCYTVLKTTFIVDVLSSYNFNGDIMGYPIDL